MGDAVLAGAGTGDEFSARSIKSVELAAKQHSHSTGIYALYKSRGFSDV
jgi:hypothetical protein